MVGETIFPKGLGGDCSLQPVWSRWEGSPEELGTHASPSHACTSPAHFLSTSSLRGEMVCLDMLNGLIPSFLLQALGQWGLWPFVGLGHL